MYGALEPMASVNNMELAAHRKRMTGSLIGSITDTREILDFCAKHAIGPDVELIKIEDINSAYDKIESGNVRFRHVIDMSSINKDS